MTVELTSTSTKIVFWIVLAICGALGGLAAELAKSRKIGPRTEEGAIELSKRLTPRILDIGTPAAMIVGVVAAAVAAWIFALVEQVPTGAGAASSTVDRYDVVKLVGVAIIAGFTGPKFLQTAGERLVALVDQQHVESALRSTGAASKAQAKTAGKVAAADTPAAAASAAVEQHAEVVQSIVQEALTPGSVTRVPTSTE